MNSFILAITGTWLLSDAVYSILLYLTSPSVDGVMRQTWARDHSIRVVRGVLAIVILIIAWRLI